MARARTRPQAERTARLDGSAWISAALDALADGGIDAVRIEPLAKALGVTKGSFYWHFADRRALIDAMLVDWRNGRLEAIRAQAAGAESPQLILRRLADLYTRKSNLHGLAIELAVRSFARRDDAAAAAITRVDAERLALVGGLFRALGWSDADAQARAVLFYSYLFGQALLDGRTATVAMRKSAVESLLVPRFRSS